MALTAGWRDHHRAHERYLTRPVSDEPGSVIIARTRLQPHRSLPASYLLTQPHRTDKRNQFRARRWYSRGRPPSPALRPPDVHRTSTRRLRLSSIVGFPFEVVAGRIALEEPPPDGSVWQVTPAKFGVLNGGQLLLADTARAGQRFDSRLPRPSTQYRLILGGWTPCGDISAMRSSTRAGSFRASFRPP
jgi:hypothetical protein